MNTIELLSHGKSKQTNFVTHTGININDNDSHANVLDSLAKPLRWFSQSIDEYRTERLWHSGLLEMIRLDQPESW